MKQKTDYLHVAFFGSSYSGKSTLARRFSRGGNRQQIIYDPVAPADINAAANWHDGWRPDRRKNTMSGMWGRKELSTEIFTEPVPFLRAVSKAKDCDVFIDEAADIFSLKQTENAAIITRGRHRGLRVFFCSQRPTMVSPTVREQVAVCYLFRLARRDSDAVLADCGFNRDILAGKIPRAAGEVVTISKVEGRVVSGFWDAAGLLPDEYRA